MDSENAKTLGTEPYKGVRDFYPEDMFIQKFIFNTMRKTVESFGYVEYNASILEPTELYKAKSGEEIINEQTYSFKDRGDRDVTLRPEMTPTVTRMVAAKKRELALPIRWYSIPNLFRYEKPQRGRLREHYQLNVDLFGVDNANAEVEVISVAHTIMKNFGASDSDFKIKVSNRKILTYLLEETFNLKKTEATTITRLIDKKQKISADDFKSEATKVLKNNFETFNSLLSAKDIETFKKIAADKASSDILGTKETEDVLQKLESLGISNAEFDPTLARGFDYYTGIVFEVYDTNKDNPRALFGGGRYDDLLSVFGSDKVPAVGFGMGDVTTRDFLETHKLLPHFVSPTDLAICVVGMEPALYAQKVARNIRGEGIKVAVDGSNRKIATQIQSVNKLGIPFIMVIGENEMKDETFLVKELASGKETVLKSEKEIAEFLKTKKSKV